MANEYIKREDAFRLVTSECQECIDFFQDTNNEVPDCRLCMLFRVKIGLRDMPAADAIEELQQIAEHYEQTAKDYWKEACDYKAEIPRWISVTERLPENRTDVLAMTADCDIYVCDFIPSVRQFWTIPGDDLHIDDITHWMQLPQPPTEQMVTDSNQVQEDEE